MAIFSGYQLRDTLSREAGLQFEDFKLILQECASRCLQNYWIIKKFAPISSTRIRQLVSDGISAGQLGKKRVNDQLKKLNDFKKLDELEVSQTTSEIIQVLAFFATKSNYARYRTRCIFAHLDNLADEFGINNFQNIQESEKLTFKKYSQFLLQAKIDSFEELEKWILNVHELLVNVSNSFEFLDNIDNTGLSSRAKKGFIASKNLPTYKKHWISFVKEVISPNFKQLYKSEDSLQNVVVELEKINNFSKLEMKKHIEENLNQSIIKVQPQKNISNHYSNLDSLTLEIPYSDGKLKISFNKTGINKELIEPLLKSVSIQTSINKSKSKKSPLISKIQNETGFILIEIDSSKNININQLQNILEQL